MKGIWWSKRAISLHVVLIVLVPTFLLLARWQFSRALHGNTLSWAYTFEWPFFTAYAIWMWWKLVHEEDARPALRRKASKQPAVPSVTANGTDSAHDDGAGEAPASELEIRPNADFDPYDESDPELAAYNRYLASLHEADRRAK